MKFNKQVAAILILLSMLLSAIAIAVYLYNENKKTAASNNQMLTIYIATKNIPMGTKITDKLIRQSKVARQFILNKPLLKKEILGKFAKENIYKNEAFLKEKLSEKIEKKEEIQEDLSYKYNSYNMSLELFENPNYSLKPNDIIKIISVYPKSTKKENDFSVQYVAKNIRILGFQKDGRATDKPIVKKKVKKLVNKKQVEEIIDIKSDEIVLDIKEKTLLKLIDNYNKGKQLWMVKSKMEEEEDSKKIKELFKPKKKVAKKTYKSYKPRTYSVKWYNPKSTVSTKTATISYADKKELNQTKKAKITSSFNQECGKTDKLLLGTSNTILLKTNPSSRAKTHKRVYKNYVLPYTSISKINTSWYMLCDGSYVRKRDVKEISYEEYLKLK